MVIVCAIATECRLTSLLYNRSANESLLSAVRDQDGGVVSCGMSLRCIQFIVAEDGLTPP
jgi:hypothetical protein